MRALFEVHVILLVPNDARSQTNHLTIHGGRLSECELKLAMMLKEPQVCASRPHDRARHRGTPLDHYCAIKDDIPQHLERDWIATRKTLRVDDRYKPDRDGRAVRQ